MEQVNVKELLEAGVHFGHQTHRWNPKMRPYIFTQRGGIHIIDLSQTEKQLNSALKMIADTVAIGGSVLFVGTKQQAKNVVEAEALRSGQPYVTNRWLGGMLTNFKTIKQSIDRLHKLVFTRDSGQNQDLTKKESLLIDRDIAKLDKNLCGIKNIKKLPSVMFVIDPKCEDIACKEARKLGMSIVAVCDTNCDPSGIDYLIAGNDDAIRSISLITKAVADACMEGAVRYEQNVREQSSKTKEAKDDRKSGPAVVEKKMGGRGRAYVGGRPERDDVAKEDLEKYSHVSAEKKEETK